MIWSPSASIIATIAYADIFSYPLSSTEIYHWLIGYRLQYNRVKALLPGEHDPNTYYHLPTRGKTAYLRRDRKRISQLKFEKAYRAVKWLKHIPTILLIGITGGVAMHNARSDDDIDFLIIVRTHTLWVTRLCVLLLIELVADRRRPDDHDVTDKICLNMFLSETSLGLPENERDLYGAHEILQMRAVFDRQGTYVRFLTANSWVRRFLPNAWVIISKTAKTKLTLPRGSGPSTTTVAEVIIIFLLRLFEPASRVVQRWYMRSRLTTEIVTDDVLRFHPSDARVWVRSGLAKRLAGYKIPLDKVFGCL